MKDRFHDGASEEYYLIVELSLFFDWEVLYHAVWKRYSNPNRDERVVQAIVKTIA